MIVPEASAKQGIMFSLSHVSAYMDAHAASSRPGDNIEVDNNIIMYLLCFHRQRPEILIATFAFRIKIRPLAHTHSPGPFSCTKISI
jgi:hypothetical protein